MRALTLVVVMLTAVVLPAFVGGPAAAGVGTPTFAIYPAPTSLPYYNDAGEPSIGVNWNTNPAGGGTVMMQAYAATYKVVFNDATVPAGATWNSVTPPGSVVNIDPILTTDIVTGRTWAGGLSGACSIMFYSDNDGTSWSTPTNTCSGTVDHETIGSGPYHSPAPLLARYTRAVYYCSQNGIDACSTSTDGGVTYGAPVTVTGACGGLHGHVKVSADGTAYLPNNNCGTKVGGGITTNNGGAWSSYTIPGSVSAAQGFDPSVATTPNNYVYQAWSQGGNYHPYVARSTNHGATWDRVTDLSNTVSPPILTSTFQTAIAGDNGRVAVAFLGSTTGGGAWWSDLAWPGTWDLYVSYTYDDGLTWTTIKASTDPIQRGCIWDAGGSSACRNMLDFMDMQLTKDGRVVVGLADGCTGACAGPSGTNAQSTSAWATIYRQSTGKGLFAAYDTGGATVPSAPTLNSATAGNAQVTLSWSAPSNNGGASITSYKVYRGTTSGGETLVTSGGCSGLGNVLTCVDGGRTNGQTLYYKVAATNSVGTGAQSNGMSATPTAGNVAPTACFTHSETNLATSVNGGCSTDSDGTIASHSWNWGDATAAGSGVTASHTYAAAGTYTVTLTVTDNLGATGTTSQSVTVASSGDPDPTTPNLSNGVTTSGTNGAAGTWKYYKISVPAGKTRLVAVLDGQACGLVQCNPDLDLFVKQGAKPTLTSKDCSGETGSADETCTVNNPAANWWYVGVYVYSGSSAKTYTIKATYS